jgi:hypothetical protein
MNQNETPSSTVALKKERLMSIDALRGFDMLWIVGGESVMLALTKWVGGPVWMNKLKARKLLFSELRTGSKETH